MALYQVHSPDLFHLPISGACQIGGAVLFGPLGSSALYLVQTVGLLMTITLAAISWRFFERRIVRWGHRFRYRTAEPRPRPAVAAGG